MRYWPCNRCGKKGVYLCHGMGLPQADYTYRWTYHLGCRYCHWHQIVYVRSERGKGWHGELETALARFGKEPHGLVTRDYRRRSLPYEQWLAAGGEPIP